MSRKKVTDEACLDQAYRVLDASYESGKLRETMGVLGVFPHPKVTKRADVFVQRYVKVGLLSFKSSEAVAFILLRWEEAFKVKVAEKTAREADAEDGVVYRSALPAQQGPVNRTSSCLV